jgi:hypothetical protein
MSCERVLKRDFFPLHTPLDKSARFCGCEKEKNIFRTENFSLLIFKFRVTESLENRPVCECSRRCKLIITEKLIMTWRMLVKNESAKWSLKILFESERHLNCEKLWRQKPVNVCHEMKIFIKDGIMKHYVKFLLKAARSFFFVWKIFIFLVKKILPHDFLFK